MSDDKLPQTKTPSEKAVAKEFLAPTPDEFQALQDEFLDLQGDDSDYSYNRRAEIRRQFRKWGPHAGCGDEPMVTLTVPETSVDDKTPFKINQKVYKGIVIVPACEARQLAYMIDRNIRVDRERFRNQTTRLAEQTISAKTVS